MQLVSPSIKLPDAAGVILWKGPIVKNGSWHCCWSCTSDVCSRQFMVFKMIAEDILVLRAVAISCNKPSIWFKLEIVRSLNLRG